MHITPEACAAVYDMLRHFRPFKAWKLPPGEEVEFRVRKINHYGEVTNYVRTDELIMWISDKRHPTLNDLAMTVAHEMCHVRQHFNGQKRLGHGPAFQRMAKTICKELGWDERLF